jgi:hypothetical protein
MRYSFNAGEIVLYHDWNMWLQEKDYWQNLHKHNTSLLCSGLHASDKSTTKDLLLLFPQGISWQYNVKYHWFVNRNDESLVESDGMARATPAQWRIVWPHQAKWYHGKRILNAPDFISWVASYIWARKGIISKATFFCEDVYYMKLYHV